MENGNFWRQQALTVTRCLLHAAALADRTATDIFRWSHSAGAAKEAVGILAARADAVGGWGRALDGIISADQRTRDSVWAMVANTFAPLADPHVLAAVTADPAKQSSTRTPTLRRGGPSTCWAPPLALPPLRRWSPR